MWRETFLSVKCYFVSIEMHAKTFRFHIYNQYHFFVSFRSGNIEYLSDKYIFK